MHSSLIFIYETTERFSAFDGSFKISDSDIGRIISNLLTNAVEASESEKKIFISMDVDEVDGLLILSIRDQGSGMDEDRLNQLRSRGGTFGKVAGNGLGLSHLRTTIESCGGKWRINSWPGRGTTVEIQIPILRSKNTVSA